MAFCVDSQRNLLLTIHRIVLYGVRMIIKKVEPRAVVGIGPEKGIIIVVTDGRRGGRQEFIVWSSSNSNTGVKLVTKEEGAKAINENELYVHDRQESQKNPLYAQKSKINMSDNKNVNGKGSGLIGGGNGLLVCIHQGRVSNFGNADGYEEHKNFDVG
eukprot:scaffold3579_cov245-Skeletonema_marinoi.AAC.4